MKNVPIQTVNALTATVVQIVIVPLAANLIQCAQRLKVTLFRVAFFIFLNSIRNYMQ